MEKYKWKLIKKVNPHSTDILLETHKLELDSDFPKIFLKKEPLKYTLTAKADDYLLKKIFDLETGQNLDNLDCTQMKKVHDFLNMFLEEKKK